jgi:pimeloyl-ACP methyl ester carboxylesterase
MPSASLNGIDLRYEIAGDGPPVVFLHGLGSSADDWALQIPEFARHFRVVTLDMRGHGASKARNGYSIEQMADDVAGLLTQLGLRPAHVVGLSLGGCVSIALGIRHPVCVRALVLVNTFAKYQPPPGGRRRTLKRLWLLLFAPISEVAKFVARGLFPKPEQRPLYEAAVASLSKNPKSSYWAALNALRKFDARAELYRINCPTLVVMGERDMTVPSSAGIFLRNNIPDAQQLIILDSGHATPMDQHNAFNMAVTRFLGVDNA